MCNRKNCTHSHSHRIAIEIAHNEIGEKNGDVMKEEIKSLSDTQKMRVYFYLAISVCYRISMPCLETR